MKLLIALDVCGNTCVSPSLPPSLPLLGDGKTHYIERQLAECPAQLKIAVNEAFTPLSAIKKLCQLPTETPGCGVFFNFTLLPPGVRLQCHRAVHYMLEGGKK